MDNLNEFQEEAFWENEYKADLAEEMRKEDEQLRKDGAFDDVVADSLKEKEEIPY